MEKRLSIWLCVVGGIALGPAWIQADPVSSPGVTTQPAPATEPADTKINLNEKPDLKSETAQRHKNVDERWQRLQESNRDNLRSRWSDAQVTRTYKPGALARLSMYNGILQADATDADPNFTIRVEVEGSNALWTLSRPRGVVGAAGGAPVFAYHPTITRYDFDAQGDDPWQTRLMVGDRTLNFRAQTLYGTTQISQTAGGFSVQVCEYTQWQQPQTIVFSAQARTLQQLRSEHPEEFRVYALPVLLKFADASFLQPGPADVYSVWVEIQADPQVQHQVEQILPQLDADDPSDREAASANLQRLARPHCWRRCVSTKPGSLRSRKCGCTLSFPLFVADL